MLEQNVEELFRRACRIPLVPARDRQSGPLLEGEAIEALLPHRDTFLFVDQITHVGGPPSLQAPFAGEPAGSIVCRYDLGRAIPIISGHFPGRPLWPGVLQVEAVGQAGLCLFRLLDKEAGAEKALGYILTDILAGRCLRPVVPVGEVEIVARILRDGLFMIVVGQCLKHDQVCSAAAVRGIEKEV
jgi:3-hydroxymyristoyl/3-hydroxydecanoyl-(acyl carrier protein) dehydratase